MTMLPNRRRSRLPRPSSATTPASRRALMGLCLSLVGWGLTRSKPAQAQFNGTNGIYALNHMLFGVMAPSLTVATPGTGYAPGDTVTLDCPNTTTFNYAGGVHPVVTYNGTSWTLTNSGVASSIPSTGLAGGNNGTCLLTQKSTTGSGTGITFNATFGFNASSLNGGNTYSSSNTQVTFGSLANIQASIIPSGISSITCLSYSVPGDLRGDVMLFTRVGSQPSYPGYVQSADGAYWQLNMNEVNVFMFGALGIGTSGNDDYPAISAALSYCNNRITNSPLGDPQNSSLVTLKFPACNGYYSSQTIAITNTMAVIGSGFGSQDHISIPISFPIGVTGLTVSYSTAPYTYLKGLSLVGVTDKTLTNSIAHGFVINATVKCEDCSATTFSGVGFYNNGRSGGTPFGFTDQSVFRRCSAYQNGRHGFWTIGADSQVSIFEQCVAVSNAGWGFKDEANYGNKYDTCQSSGNGWPSSASSFSDSIGPLVVESGVVYIAVPVDALTGTPATATTTPGTNGAVWALTGIPTAGLPTWTLNSIYRDGGDFYGSGAPHVYINCYSESGPSASWLTGLAIALGGTWSSFASQFTPIMEGTAEFLTSLSPIVSEFIPFPSSPYGTENISCYLGCGFGQANATRTITGSVSGGFYEYLFNKDLYFDVSLSNGFTAYWVTGVNTTQQFGSGVAQPHVLATNTLGLGVNDTGEIVMTVGTAAPSSGHAGLGWIVWNSAPTPGGNAGWICTTAGVNGSTSVWKTFGTIST